MDFDKMLKRNIADVKRGVRNLRKQGMKVEMEEVETLMGTEVVNVYIVDYLADMVVLKKHLFTA